jgi:hypothetical protein
VEGAACGMRERGGGGVEGMEEEQAVNGGHAMGLTGRPSADFARGFCGGAAQPIMG